MKNIGIFVNFFKCSVIETSLRRDLDSPARPAQHVLNATQQATSVHPCIHLCNDQRIYVGLIVPLTINQSIIIMICIHIHLYINVYVYV